MQLKIQAYLSALRLVWRLIPHTSIAFQRYALCNTIAIAQSLSPRLLQTRWYTPFGCIIFFMQSKYVTFFLNSIKTDIF